MLHNNAYVNSDVQIVWAPIRSVVNEAAQQENLRSDR